jgi:hypothetical protein
MATPRVDLRSLTQFTEPDEEYIGSGKRER